MYPPKTSYLSLALNEFIAMAAMEMPMILTRLSLYARSMISMVFYTPLIDDQLALSGGSFAIGFAHITGYTFLYSLARGMEPISSQAFGAGNHTRLGHCLQKTILLLLSTSIPISLLWFNMHKILLFCGETVEFATAAQTYLLYSIADLVVQSLLHPLRFYLLSQSITWPQTLCASLSVVLHFPIDYILITKLQLGIKGVAISTVLIDFCFLAFLIIYILTSRVYKKTWGGGFWREGFKGWNSILNHAVQSFLSFYLEHGRYKMMIFLCRSLINPGAFVASMRILFELIRLIYVFASSLSSCLSIRVGNHLGAGRLFEAKQAAIVGLICSSILGISALFFAGAVRNLWPVMFTQDEEIVALTSLVIPIVALCLLGNCLLTTGFGVLRATAPPEIGAKIILLCFYVNGMLVAGLLGVHMGLGFKGLWLVMLVLQIFEVLTLLVVLGQVDWKAVTKRAIELTHEGGDVVSGFNDEAPMNLMEA